jgi:sugar phosphate isomerase/epimerase
MAETSRRRFLAATGCLAALGREMRANPLGMPIGCQTYPVRTMLAADFPGTIRTLADAGFQSIELCSPWVYKEFSELTKYSGKELRGMLNDMGVRCESAHFGLKELRENQAARVAWALDMGMTQMAVASLSGPKNPTMDDVKRAADDYNKIGEQAQKAGIQQALHNETFETSMVGDKRVYDTLFEMLDPKLVKFQFQISTIAQGFDAVEYFTKYAGRFVSMHVQGWSLETKQQMAVGKDSLDWKKIFAAAKVGGIKNYFVEMNLDLMKASVPYLRSLEV